MRNVTMPMQGEDGTIVQLDSVGLGCVHNLKASFSKKMAISFSNSTPLKDVFMFYKEKLKHQNNLLTLNNYAPYFFNCSVVLF